MFWRSYLAPETEAMWKSLAATCLGDVDLFACSVVTGQTGWGLGGNISYCALPAAERCYAVLSDVAGLAAPPINWIVYEHQMQLVSKPPNQPESRQTARLPAMLQQNMANRGNRQWRCRPSHVRVAILHKHFHRAEETLLDQQLCGP